MLSSDDKKIALALKARLVDAGVPVHEVVVYGSRARGDNTPDSDLDVCLVLDRVDEAIQKLVSHIAWEVGYDHDVIVMTMEYTKAQLEDTPLRSSPFVQAVRTDGVVV